MNSKYFTIEGLRFRNTSGFSDTITGTIVNTPPDQIPLAHVYAILYDKDNKVSSTELGSVDASQLKPGDNSALKIDLIGIRSSDTVDHYMVIPGEKPL